MWKGRETQNTQTVNTFTAYLSVLFHQCSELCILYQNLEMFLHNMQMSSDLSSIVDL